MITGAEVAVNFDSKAVPKIMDVTVGDNTSHLIAFDANSSWAKDLNAFTGNYYSVALNTSYDLIIEQGKLVLFHSRLGKVQLEPRIPNLVYGRPKTFFVLGI